MSEQPANGDRPIKLHELYPQLGEDELRQAEENLKRYLALTLRIFERAQNDPATYARLRTLTGQEGYVTLKDEGRSVQ